MRLRVQYVGRDRRRAFRDPQLSARVIGDLPFDRHSTKVIERANVDRDGDLRVGIRRNGLERGRQTRIVELRSVYRDMNAALVVAVALEHGLQPVDILLRTAHQRKRANGRFLLQRFKLRAAFQRRVERAVAGGLDGHGIGLRIRCVAGGRCKERERLWRNTIHGCRWLPTMSRRIRRKCRR